jgi:hypothetical protein
MFHVRHLCKVLANISGLVTEWILASRCERAANERRNQVVGANLGGPRRKRGLIPQRHARQEAAATAVASFAGTATP